MAALTVAWLCGELSKLLGFEASEDIGSYILTFETKEDVEDYLTDLLGDTSVPKNKRFLAEVKRRWKPPPKQIELPDNITVYRKQDNEEETLVPKKGGKKKGRKSGGTESNSNAQHQSTPPRSTEPQPIPKTDSDKKKNKFVPLFSRDGEDRTVAKLPGRHACECLATKHGLVNNCTSCGRIVCQQEGSGPCLFCGKLVCTREEEEVLARGSKKSEALRSDLMAGKMLPHQAQVYQKGLEKAMEHKNKLLNYDKTSTKRTKVIDDESDYFNADSNRWLTKEQKAKLAKREEELRAKRNASRLDRKVTLDFAGRQVVEEHEEVNMYDMDDDVVQEVYYGKVASEGTNGDVSFNDDDFAALVHPTAQQQPQFIAPKSSSKKKTISEAATEDKRSGLRLQDRELKDMVDEGMCMSMHQPWATLLVKGIKKHEGRSWYSAHRGRLWIAATSQTPRQEEIDQLEEFYRQYYKDPHLQFPSEYPSACLLGSVDVQDVMEQDTYRKKFPDGESNSPYVFVCDNPHELLVKFPIKGKHKIYKLDGKIHQGAKKGARSVVPPH